MTYFTTAYTQTASFHCVAQQSAMAALRWIFRLKLRCLWVFQLSVNLIQIDCGFYPISICGYTQGRGKYRRCTFTICGRGWCFAITKTAAVLPQEHLLSGEVIKRAGEKWGCQLEEPGTMSVVRLTSGSMKTMFHYWAYKWRTWGHFVGNLNGLI